MAEGRARIDTIDRGKPRAVPLFGESAEGRLCIHRNGSLSVSVTQKIRNLPYREPISLAARCSGLSAKAEKFEFRLYLSGSSGSLQAIQERLASLCSRDLPDQHAITVLNLSELGDRGDLYRLATTPGVLGDLPPAIMAFLESIAFDKRLFVWVERAESAASAATQETL